MVKIINEGLFDDLLSVSSAALDKYSSYNISHDKYGHEYKGSSKDKKWMDEVVQSLQYGESIDWLIKNQEDSLNNANKRYSKFRKSLVKDIGVDSPYDNITSKKNSDMLAIIDKEERRLKMIQYIKDNM